MNMTQRLYPQMMQNTKMLIVDYNIMRYHTFDWVRMKLMLEKHFFTFKHAGFVKCSVLDDFIDYAVHRFDVVNPQELFGDPPLVEFPNGIIEDLAKGVGEIQSRVTMTDFSRRIGIIFERQDMSGVILRAKSDTTTYQLPESVRVDEVPDAKLFDVEYIINIIQTNAINAVVVDTVDMAALLAMRITDRPISFMIPRYAYNYEARIRGSDEVHLLKGISWMNEAELKYRHEFGTFDPFADLAHYKKLRDLEASQPQTEGEG